MPACHLPSIDKIAEALGGDVTNGGALVPGPGHSAEDRSLAIKCDSAAPDGFMVHSFAGDDPIMCRDHVRRKLGLPEFKSKKKRRATSATVPGSRHGHRSLTGMYTGKLTERRTCKSAGLPPKGFSRKSGTGKCGSQASRKAKRYRTACPSYWPPRSQQKYISLRAKKMRTPWPG